MEMTETGKVVYERTYARPKPDGTKETWPETVERVVDGNIKLNTQHLLDNERERLIELMTEFKVLPAGRHLWASGVGGRQYLFNCHVSGWGTDVTDHFTFTFLRLMEGGGVGANYSNYLLADYDYVQGDHHVHIVCDEEHPDYQKMKDAGLLSDVYSAGWPGPFEVEDSREGWASALTDLLSTYYRPAKYRNRVFDVSRVRAEGKRLKTFGGRASGPAPLAVMLHEVSEVMNRHEDEKLTGLGAMEIDHAIATCVVSGGNRRSARMAIMHWEDPQIMEFVNCKQETGKHWTTNISVEVDDEFWTALEENDQWATNVLGWIAQGMLENGEPGFWDSSFSNLGEPNPVQATNPCGEIALEAWENCNLGHINLAAFVGPDGILWDELLESHRLMTRFLMRATYGDVNDPKQAAVLARNRRIGVGHFGFASMLAMLGIRYSDAPRDPFVEDMLMGLSATVDTEASVYAHLLRIPVPVKTRTVAPTGTIAKMPGVSEGIHPIFAKYFIRRIRFSTVDSDQMATAARYEAQGYKVEKCQYAPNTLVVEIPTKDSLIAEVEARFGEEQADGIVQSAADIDLEDMLGVQALYQGFWADNAVSYTANVDPAMYTTEDVMDVLAHYGNRVKGVTLFPEMSMAQSPYERITKEEYESAASKDVADGVDENCVSGSCPVK